MRLRRVRSVGEVEDANDQFHGVIGSLRSRHGAHVVDEEVDSSWLPVHGVAVRLADVQRISIRGELLVESRISEPMDAATEGHRDAVRPAQHAVTEDLNQADLAAAHRLILQTDQPRRKHGPRADGGPAGHLDMPVMRRETPLGRLGLGDNQAFRERLLPAAATHRSRPIPTLDRGHP